MLRILLVFFALCATAHSEERSPRETERKAEASQPDNQHGGIAPQATAPIIAPAAPIINVYTAKHAGEESRCTQPKSWEEWGSFAWCSSLEWIDAERTIAIFTVFLGIATGFLWWATRNLVKEAKETSERQLRAYVSATPEKVLNWTNNFDAIGVTFRLKNHGQTPALEVASEFTIEVLDGAPDLKVVHVQADHGIAIFPQEEVPTQLMKSPRPSHEEVKDVETDKRRVHIWGRVLYRDAFGEPRSTIINVSFGGADFAKAIRKTDGTGWNWRYGQRHNEPA
jgi:hypothetical protein